VKGKSTALEIALVVVVAVALGAALSGWLVMLLCGTLWHTFAILKPIGFWPSAGIGVLLSILTAQIKGGGSK
jgi:hypothetical protein